MNIASTLMSLLNATAAAFFKLKPTKVPGIPPLPVNIPPPPYQPPVMDTRKNHEELMSQAIEGATELERDMSPGGTQIITYMNDLQITVGGQYITPDIAPAVSVVDGAPVPSKISIGNKRSHIDQKSTPHVQSISHSIPWGTFSIVACNKFNTVVGTGGILLQTAGNMDINSSGRTTVSSLYELNLTSSSGNINVFCGHNITLRGDTVTIQTNNSDDQVVINSNLGIARNLTVHGSMYIDGEVFCQHISAPVSTRETSAGAGSFGSLPSDEVMGYTDLKDYINFVDDFIDHVNRNLTILHADHLRGYGPYPKWPSLKKWGLQTFLNKPMPKIAVHALGAHNNDDPGKALHIHPHKHVYYAVNSSLYTGNGLVRDAASADIDSGKTGKAKEQVHGGPGLM